MFDDFSYMVAWAEQAIEVGAIRERLAGWAECRGEIADLGPRGLRFIPENQEWPPTYFCRDGKTVEMVVKDLDSYEVDVYLTSLARRLGTVITTETLEYR